MKISIGPDGWLAVCGVLFSDNRQAGIICLLCALIHELGHICAAKFMHVELSELRLGFAGARIYPADENMPYRKEFFLCACGPIFNLISALAAALLIFLSKGDSIPTSLAISDAISILDGSGEGIISALYLFISVSLLQAFLNLLPVESLDGGRMMVSAISQFGDVHTAQRAQTVSTALAAVTLWTLSVYILLRTGNGIGVLVSAACMFSKILSRELTKKS